MEEKNATTTTFIDEPIAISGLRWQDLETVACSTAPSKLLLEDGYTALKDLALYDPEVYAAYAPELTKKCYGLSRLAVKDGFLGLGFFFAQKVTQIRYELGSFSSIDLEIKETNEKAAAVILLIANRFEEKGWNNLSHEAIQHAFDWSEKDSPVYMAARAKILKKAYSELGIIVVGKPTASPRGPVLHPQKGQLLVIKQ